MPTLHPDQFYGKGLGKLFPEGSAGVTSAPFPRAGRSKEVRDYDETLVHKTLNAPPQPTSFDPRTLSSTQPNVTRAGVAHYMRGGSYERSGETFADKEQAGNQYPVIYSRSESSGEQTHMILSGHHRATSALLEGRQLKGLHVEGGWGGPRRS